MANLPFAQFVEPELAVQKFELDANINCFQNPFILGIAGPTLCGKSTFILNLLQHRESLMTTKFSRIIYRLPTSDLHSEKRQEYLARLRAAIPGIEIETGLPKASDIRFNNLPKLVILGKYITRPHCNFFCFC
jgi:pantothenate kinase-related protein Tda10